MSNSPSAPYSDQQLQQIGEKFLSAGDFGQALKFLLWAEERRPNDPVIQYDLALAFAARRMTDEALNRFQKAVTLKPDYSEAYNALGAFYADRNQLDLAEDAFKKAMVSPFYETPQLAHYNLGRLYEKKGLPDLALQQYQDAIRLQPNYGMAYFRMAKLLEGGFNRGDEARRAYRKAIEYAPSLAEAHLRYGMMNYRAGDHETARQSLKQVVKLAPDSELADEARKTLDRLDALAALSNPEQLSTMVAPGQAGRVEVLTEKDLRRQRSERISRPLQTPPPAPMPEAAAPTPAPAEPAAPERGAPPEPAAQPAKAPDQTSSPNHGVEAPQSAVPAPPAAEQPSQETAPPAQPAEAQSGPAPEGVSPESAALQEGAQEPMGPPSPPPEPQFRYIVQLGSFLDKTQAEELRKELQGKGYQAVVKSLRHKTLGPVFVVQLKPVNNLSKATTLMTQLEIQVAGRVEGKPVIIKVPLDM